MKSQRHISNELEYKAKQGSIEVLKKNYNAILVI